MPNIYQLYENVRKMDDIEDITRTVVLDSVSQDLLIELQKDQLMRGENERGESIEPEYASFSYAKFKNRINPRAGFGTPDMKYTGAFFNAFFFDEDDLEVYSRDEKVERLIAKYGDIFGFHRESLDPYAAYFIRNFKEEFMSQMTGE